MPCNDMEKRAQNFASNAHHGQMYGEFPYTHHLSAVAAIAEGFDAPQAVRVAAWLHDTIEDTHVEESELEAEFGPEVARLVVAVTNPPGSRRERAEAACKKVRAGGSDAVLLKLCDRLANVSCAENGLLKMYQKEWPLFYEILYVEGEHELLWRTLKVYLE